MCGMGAVGRGPGAGGGWRGGGGERTEKEGGFAYNTQATAIYTTKNENTKEEKRQHIQSKTSGTVPKCMVSICPPQQRANGDSVARKFSGPFVIFLINYIYISLFTQWQANGPTVTEIAK